MVGVGRQQGENDVPKSRERFPYMLATVKGRIGRAFMHILFLHYSAALLPDTPSIGVTQVVLCMTYSFLFQS